MQITPQQRRSVVVALIVLILLLLFLLWFFLLRGGEEVVPVEEKVIDTAPIVDTTPSASKITPVSVEAASARVVASNFVERFGTYSTDAPFANVKEVKDLATPEYYTVLLGDVTDVGSDTFIGVTSRVLAVTLVSGSEETGSAKYTVSVQNKIEQGTRSNSTIEYKTASVGVEKRGTAWLVSSFQWQ